eukprot:gene11316-4128_t
MELLVAGLSFSIINYFMKDKETKNKNGKLIFIGTGTSAGVPLVSCLTKPQGPCPTCSDAIKPNSKNRRRNTSILLQKEVNGESKNLLIDCGKFFFQSAIDIFPKYKITKIDSVLLTHEHLDATGGLDDLRDLIPKDESITVHLRQKDLETLKKTHFYLVNSALATGSGVVAQLKFEVYEPETILKINDFEIEQFEVFHGENYMCSAFKFYNIAYLSDVSSIPDKVRPHLENLDLLIIDCLARRLKLDPNKKYSLSHLLLDSSIEEVRKLKPKKAMFVGMCHTIEHHQLNEELDVLKSQGLDIELAYDSMCINIDLQ